MDADDLSKENDPFGLKRKFLERQMVHVTDDMHALEVKKPMVYATIKGQLSTASLSRLERDKKRFAEAERLRCPLRLSKLILTSHMLSNELEDIDESRDSPFFICLVEPTVGLGICHLWALA